MPIEFRCTQCNKLLRTGDETAGKQAKCPECGSFMTVPAGVPAAAGATEEPPLPPGDAASPFGAGGPFESAGPFESGGVENPYESPQQVGQAYGTAPPPGAVPNYLVQAILVTLFCCLPFGIVSIVYAAQVNGKLAGGDYQGAIEASNAAKTWTMVSFICGVIPAVLYMLAVCAGMAMG